MGGAAIDLVSYHHLHFPALQHTMGDPNEREPCPHRIIDDVGVAFSMGAIGGTFWHAIKGARSSPKGERLYGSVAGVCALENQPSRSDTPASHGFSI